MTALSVLALLVLASSEVCRAYSPQRGARFPSLLRTQTSAPYTAPTAATTEQDLSLRPLFEDHMDEVAGREISFSAPLPSWLHGTLLRNGAGLFGTVDGAKASRRYAHAFDGLAKLTSFTFNKDSGKTLFSMRFLRTAWYERIVQNKGDLPCSANAAPTEPPHSGLQKFLGLFDAGFDNANVHSHRVAGTGPVVTTTDAPFLVEIDPVSLATVRVAKYPTPITTSGGLELFSTSHPHADLDASKQCSYNYFLEAHPVQMPFGKPKSNLAHVARFDKDLRRTVIGTVEVGDTLPYVHEISITPNFAVLCLWSVTTDFARISNGEGFFKQMTFNDTQRTRVLVFDLNNKAGDARPVAEFSAPPLFAYHHANAFERTDSRGQPEIVLDATCYARGDIVTSENAFAYVGRMQTKETRVKVVRENVLTRFVLPLGGVGAVSIEAQSLSGLSSELGETFLEYPMVSPVVKGREHRYVYGSSANIVDEELAWSVVKHDTVASSTSSVLPSCLVWSEPACFPSEAVFVPSPQRRSEDDGVLLSQVFDAARQESFLLVLDAASMKELSRAYLGTICPLTFHGSFFE